MVDVDELLDGGGDWSNRRVKSDEEEEILPKKRKTTRKIVESSEDEQVDDPDELAGPSCGHKDQYPVGSWVVVVYEAQWYIAQVEGEEPEEEVTGFTLLKYMERHGHNQFTWGKKADQLKTNNSDILLKVDPPIPVSSRHLGLPRDIVDKVFYHLTVKWSFNCCFIYCFLIFLLETLLKSCSKFYFAGKKLLETDTIMSRLKKKTKSKNLV